MSVRVAGALALAIVSLSLSAAREKEQPGPPAVLELRLPAGAVATADGKELADPRRVTIDDLKPTEVRRVKLAVTFADGATDERLVDVSAGQRLPVAVEDIARKVDLGALKAATQVRAAATG